MATQIPQASGTVYDKIDSEIIPDVIKRFIDKRGDYQDTFLLLGAKGQFSDINRKFWKLYNSVWKDQPLKGEQPEEIVEDFIGHCFLLIYCLREGING